MRIPKKYHHIATDASVDIDPDGTLFVWLNYGYAYEAQERSHSRGFDSWKDVIESLKYVEQCDCPECSKYERGLLVGAGHMSDKQYQIGNHEDQQEFDRKRNKQ